MEEARHRRLRVLFHSLTCPVKVKLWRQSESVVAELEIGAERTSHRHKGSLPGDGKCPKTRLWRCFHNCVNLFKKKTKQNCTVLLEWMSFMFCKLLLKKLQEKSLVGLQEHAPVGKVCHLFSSWQWSHAAPTVIRKAAYAPKAAKPGNCWPKQKAAAAATAGPWTTPCVPGTTLVLPLMWLSSKSVMTSAARVMPRSFPAWDSGEWLLAFSFTMGLQSVIYQATVHRPLGPAFLFYFTELHTIRSLCLASST